MGLAWLGGVIRAKDVACLATGPYSLLVDTFTVHLCGVSIIDADAPDYLLTCEDCNVRVRGSDVEELNRLARTHREATRQPLSA